MRLMTYTAPSAAEARQLVRDNLGDNAIIVSTQTDAGGGGTRITAALEDALPPEMEHKPEPEPLSGEWLTAGGPIGCAIEDEFGENPASALVRDSIRRVLARHGTPEWLADRIAGTAVEINAPAPSAALAGALDQHFVFDPLTAEKDDAERRFILIGPPGGGKTITAAKLAAANILAGAPASVITTDVRRAGGVEQLEAFTRILGAELVTAGNGNELAAAMDGNMGALDGGEAASGLTVIDTPGTNPFDAKEMDFLSALVEHSRAEPVLVLAAGTDGGEAFDTARAFAGLGVRRMAVTRLDASRRLGCILAAADGGGLAIGGVGISPHIADGLNGLSAGTLARLMLVRRGAEQQKQDTPATEPMRETS